MKSIDNNATPKVPNHFDISYHVVLNSLSGKKAYAVVDSNDTGPSFILPWSSGTIYVNQNLSKYLKSLLKDNKKKDS